MANMSELPSNPDGLPESVTCYECDAACDSLAEAQAEGWKDLEEDRDGRSWNFLGMCPECSRSEEEKERIRLEEIKHRDAIREILKNRPPDMDPIIPFPD